MFEVFEYDFMRRAMIAAVLIGAVAPGFGVYLVLRRLSLIADTLSHVALAGVAIALLLCAPTLRASPQSRQMSPSWICRTSAVPRSCVATSATAFGIELPHC